MKTRIEKFYRMIEDRGWKCRVIPSRHLSDLREVILGYYEQGLIDKELFRDQLNFLSFDPPADLPDARSIIILAVPTPQMRIGFRWQGKTVPVVIPPTYVSYTPRTLGVLTVLTSWLKENGYLLANQQLPLKTLAVRSGLAHYGRNNICYVEEMGSFLQLAGAFSDMPCDDDPWQEPKMIDRCNTCTACLRNCPTKAISKDRFLIRAELCLTYHNEASGDYPDWINPSWHHCLVGCMRCQSVCPENKNLINWFEDHSEFTEQETDFLLRCVPLENLPSVTVSKLKSLEINENYRNLCRNLSMIIR